MIRSVSVILMAGVAWATSSLLYSGEAPSPRAIVDKAIKAHGGEANMTKYPAILTKGKGLFYGMGEGIAYTGQWAYQGTTQSSSTIEVNVAGMTFKFMAVVNGDKGWKKQNDEEATEMPKDEIAEEKEKFFTRQVTLLYPLKDKSYELSLIGEAKVGEKPALGVRVSKKGHRDVNLYFDKQSGMLAKAEYSAKDFQAGGEDFTQTVIYQQYKAVKGVQLATKILIQKDGKRFIEGEMTEQQPMEKLDNALFQRP